MAGEIAKRENCRDVEGVRIRKYKIFRAFSSGVEMTTILYSGTRNASSWALRAWLALTEAGMQFEERIVDIRHPQRIENLARIATFSPPGAVPVLVVNESVIFDSLAIMEYANEVSGGALLPSDPLTRACARSFLAWQHAGLSNTCPDLTYETVFYPEKRSITASENTQAQRLFQSLETCLSKSGDAYLFGRLSLADLALTPTVLRLFSHKADLTNFPLTAAWGETLLARPAVQTWLAEARSLPPVMEDGYFFDQ